MTTQLTTHREAAERALAAIEPQSVITGLAAAQVHAALAVAEAADHIAAALAVKPAATAPTGRTPADPFEYPRSHVLFDLASSVIGGAEDGPDMDGRCAALGREILDHLTFDERLTVTEFLTRMARGYDDGPVALVPVEDDPWESWSVTERNLHRARQVAATLRRAGVRPYSVSVIGDALGDAVTQHVAPEDFDGARAILGFAVEVETLPYGNRKVVQDGVCLYAGPEQ